MRSPWPRGARSRPGPIPAATLVSAATSAAERARLSEGAQLPRPSPAWPRHAPPPRPGNREPAPSPSHCFTPCQIGTGIAVGSLAASRGAHRAETASKRRRGAAPAMIGDFRDGSRALGRRWGYRPGRFGTLPYIRSADFPGLMPEVKDRPGRGARRRPRRPRRFPAAGQRGIPLWLRPSGVSPWRSEPIRPMTFPGTLVGPIIQDGDPVRHGGAAADLDGHPAEAWDAWKTDREPTER